MSKQCAEDDGYGGKRSAFWVSINGNAPTPALRVDSYWGNPPMWYGLLDDIGVDDKQVVVLGPLIIPDAFFPEPPTPETKP